MSEQVQGVSGKVGLDVTDFKGGISQMNQGVRVIESAFKATAAGLGDWSKSATGLEARIKALPVKKKRNLAVEGRSLGITIVLREA